MSYVHFDHDVLVALGALAGAKVLVVMACVVKANAFRERAYLMHGAASMMAVFVVQSLAIARLFPQASMLAVLALSGIQLRELLAHAGGLQLTRRWLVGVSFGLLPLLAALSLWAPIVVLGAAAVWAVVAAVVVQQAWRQSLPWVWWLLPGLPALPAAAGLLGWAMASDGVSSDAVQLGIGGLLALWSLCTYLATDLRGRLQGETQARLKARNTIDPLTGLSMPVVIHERINAARSMMRRYGHPSTVMLVHVEGLSRWAQEHGAEVAEAALLTAASRIAGCVRDGDVAARQANRRIAVLAEGLSPAEAASHIASRILVAGLKEPVPALPAEFLQFRVAMVAVPPDELAPKLLLQRLGARLDTELAQRSERRIATMTQEELLA